MSGMINVDGSDDPSYRYKMPRLMSKVEGRGNGVKTLIINCVELAGSLHRSPAQVNKYFGCELGAMTKYEEKEERCLVNGSFDTRALQEALTGYIEKFVLCPSCGNPETVQELKGKKKAAVIMLNCKACGALEEADNTHKLVTFIIKELTGSDSAMNKKELRKQKKAAKLKKKRGSEDGSNDSVSDGEKKKKKKKKKSKSTGDGESASISKKAKKEKKSKKKSKKSSKHDDIDDLTADMGNVSVHDVAAIESSVDKLVVALKEGKEQKVLLEFVAELQVNSGLEKSEQLPVLFFAIMSPSFSMQEVMENIKLLGSLKESINSSVLSDEEFEQELLRCFEECVPRLEEYQQEGLKKLSPVVLKVLYDEDILSEDAIMEWYKSTEDLVHKRYEVGEFPKALKKEVAPIIDWLCASDSDSSSDSE